MVKSVVASHGVNLPETVILKLPITSVFPCVLRALAGGVVCVIVPDEVDRVGRAHAVCETIQKVMLPGRDHARGAAVCERNVIHQWGIRQIRIGGFVGAFPCGCD